MKLNKGFTLVELLLSMAIIGVLAGLSLPAYRTLLMKNDLDIAANTIASSLRRAQVLAQAVDGDVVAENATWGVKAQSGSIVIFKGTSFGASGRDTSFDEIFDMPTTIGVGGTSEIVFTKFTGFPVTTGTINLSTESDTRAVSINEKGMVNY
jgi:prepilin-type N-terminal cleavage/methylation domain-containing protein